MIVARERLVVGTRGSVLARVQAALVADALRRAHSSLEVVIETIHTTGDARADQAVPAIGQKGVFTAELEAALLSGAIDIAVHSAKDLPTKMPDGLAVLAVPARADARDVWVGRDGVAFEALPTGAAIGTSSLRRQAQLLAIRSDVRFVAMRGNVDTRLAKLDRGACDGLVLAAAGLERLGQAGRITQSFTVEQITPAPGQGALAVQGRSDEKKTQALLAAVDDEASRVAVECERAVLARLEGGCRTPIGVYVRLVGDRWCGNAVVALPDGTRVERARAEKRRTDVGTLVNALVSELERGGAREIVREGRDG